MKKYPSKRKIATLTAVWCTFVSLVAFAGPRWLSLACEIATESGASALAPLYRVERISGLTVFLAVLMVLAWLAALVIPLIWLTRRFRLWREWMVWIPAPATVLCFLVSLLSFGLKDFADYLKLLF